MQKRRFLVELRLIAAAHLQFAIVEPQLVALVDL